MLHYEGNSLKTLKIASQRLGVPNHDAKMTLVYMSFGN